MKKVILLILLLTVVTSTFSACGDTPATESSSESATNKVVAITTTTSEKKSETSSLSTETESVAETTPSVPETQGKTETTPEPVSEKKMNLDLLSDIGLTYGEISAKRGGATQRIEGEGGYRFILENGYGEYCWSGEADMVWNENGIKEVKEQAECKQIWNIKPETMFLGMTKSMTVSEIEEIYGIKYERTHIRSDRDEIPTGEYILIFYFNNIKISVFTTDKDNVNSDSYINIGMV